MTVYFFLKAEELKFRSNFRVRLGLDFRGFPPQFSQFFLYRVKVLTRAIRATALGSREQMFRTDHRLDGAVTEPWSLNRLRDTNTLQWWLLEPAWQMAAPLHHLLRHMLIVFLGISFRGRQFPHPALRKSPHIFIFEMKMCSATPTHLFRFHLMLHDRIFLV